jgi:hypothetical protein
MESILEELLYCLLSFFQLFIGIFAGILGILSAILGINTTLGSDLENCGGRYCQKRCCSWKICDEVYR